MYIKTSFLVSYIPLLEFVFTLPPPQWYIGGPGKFQSARGCAGASRSERGFSDQVQAHVRQLRWQVLAPVRVTSRTGCLYACWPLFLEERHWLQTVALLRFLVLPACAADVVSAPAPSMVSRPFRQTDDGRAQPEILKGLTAAAAAAATGSRASPPPPRP